MDANDEKGFQYFTIVNNAENDDTIFEDDKQFVFVTLNQDNETESSAFGQTQDSLREDTLQEAVSNFTNIKLVTLDDGKIYFTDGSSPDKLQSQLTPDVIESTSSDASKQEENSDDYREIKLEDGTCAIIRTELWNSLLESISQSQTRKEKKFPCKYFGCNKVYTTSHHLTVHMRNHTGSRPYTCTVAGCDKSFSTGYSLKAHVRTHTGEKPYGCTVCTKHFKTSGDLQKHVRTHTGEKPFKCPYNGCGRSFTTSNIRKVHIRSHTGERPYSCEYPDCGKAFASATNYKNHMRIHSGERPYVCSVEGCERRFTEYSSLYKHHTVHQPFKPFQCDFCNQQFKQETTLRSHKRTVHNMVVTGTGTEFFLSEDNSQSEIILKLETSNDNDAHFMFLNGSDEGSVENLI